MPFDGTNYTPRHVPPVVGPEFFVQMLKGFERGRYWTQRSLHRGASYCIMGMAYNVQFGAMGWSPYKLGTVDPDAEFITRIAMQLGFANTNELARWNDDERRTWEDVEALLKSKIVDLPPPEAGRIRSLFASVWSRTKQKEFA
jgi:hypothetical protein